MKSIQFQSAGSTVCLALPAVVSLLLASLPSVQAGSGNDNRAPDVPAAIQVPGETNTVHFHVYAVGVQIYAWDGSSWVFQGPEAALFSDAGTHGEVGIHYVGPTWESESGSRVKGAAIANAPSPNANSIPLLLLKAVSTQGPGIFERTTFIQRLNTVGGRAPATGGTTGQVVRVPYTAEYFFYREQN